MAKMVNRGDRISRRDCNKKFQEYVALKLGITFGGCFLIFSPRGYKNNFMLNSAEHENVPAKC